MNDDKGMEEVGNNMDALIRGHKRKILIYSICAYFLYSGSYKIIPQFAEAFQKSGSRLPAITDLVISSYEIFYYLAWLSIAPALSLIRGLLGEDSLGKVEMGSKFNLAIAGIIFFIVLISMYLPIFQIS